MFLKLREATVVREYNRRIGRSNPQQGGILQVGKRKVYRSLRFTPPARGIFAFQCVALKESLVIRKIIAQWFRIFAADRATLQ